MNDYGFLFIHGAGLGGWIWKDTAGQLSEPSVCADFPARTGSLEERKKLTLDDYVASVLEQANNIKVDKIIVVAHSIGGVVALRVAEQLGDRLAGFVAVGAAIPTPEGSFLSALPFPKSIIMNLIMRLAGTQPPASAIASGLCNDLSPEQTQKVIDSFAAESVELYKTPTGVVLPAVPKLYVVLTNDKEFGVSLQKSMAQRLGGATENIGSGHLPMLSRPHELAVILQAFATSI
ncbi:MAG TPA: alpha/beta hydrolase [Candidatus Saccharimonadales bacterium]|nr:alpha/beta hydrolase [Candidatus Saccharimonadales bacterium]